MFCPCYSIVLTYLAIWRDSISVHKCPEYFYVALTIDSIDINKSATRILRNTFGAKSSARIKYFSVVHKTAGRDVMTHVDWVSRRYHCSVKERQEISLASSKLILMFQFQFCFVFFIVFFFFFYLIGGSQSAYISGALPPPGAISYQFPKLKKHQQALPA